MAGLLLPTQSAASPSCGALCQTCALKRHKCPRVDSIFFVRDKPEVLVALPALVPRLRSLYLRRPCRHFIEVNPPALRTTGNDIWEVHSADVEALAKAVEEDGLPYSLALGNS